jgi:hypothetical protein
MERRKFTREFKLEAVRLIKDRGVSYVQASAGPERSHVAAMRMGKEVLRGSAARLSWQLSFATSGGSGSAATRARYSAAGRAQLPICGPHLARKSSC